MRARSQGLRDNRSVLYQRLPRLFDVLALARGEGHHARLLKSLARVELLILDDWGLAPITAEQRRDLLEIMEDRDGRGSTMVTSQLPVEHCGAQRSPAHAQGRQPPKSGRQASEA
jgi:DNA replication protein DnaC